MRLRRDHPRSRGVYIPLTSPHGASIGSSPLARGLRYKPRSWARYMRIIPARAGFTTNSLPHGSIPQDHPRSRGVYWLVIAAEVAILGSSPLARGLPGTDAYTDKSWGIIPARAGFTAEVFNAGHRQ